MKIHIWRNPRSFMPEVLCPQKKWIKH